MAISKKGRKRLRDLGNGDPVSKVQLVSVWNTFLDPPLTFWEWLVNLFRRNGW